MKTLGPFITAMAGGKRHRPHRKSGEPATPTDALVHERSLALS